MRHSRANRNYRLSIDDFDIRQAIQFPAFDENTSNGLSANITDSELVNLYNKQSQLLGLRKWKKIVNESINSYVDFDILIPRNLRAKHACYFNEIG